MSLQLNKRSILNKTLQISGLTLLSRVLGIVREFLMAQFLGIGIVSDAFYTAFRIPNFFRHVFAEGALSASFVPVVTKTMRDGNQEEANGLMSLSFLFFEGIVLALYACVLIRADLVITLIAPGFSPEQTAYAIPFLQVLFSILLFISSSALLGGALHSVNHFFTPAFGQPLWNVVMIGALLLCLRFALSPIYFCYGVVLGALINFCAHLMVFFRQGFNFGPITMGSKAAFKRVLSKFLPCLFGVSVVELNMFVSSMFASFLPKGSVSLLYLGSRFMAIPLGMFAVALSSTLLPHFSRLVLYAPRRLNFYLLEVAKLVIWVIVPSMAMLMYLAHPLFAVLIKSKATPDQITQGGWILILYSAGLVFLCLNKILLSMLYALKDTASGTLASGVSAAINIVGDAVGIYFFGAYGIAAANSISGLAMTIMCIYLLHTRHKIVFYLPLFMRFMMRFALQSLVAVTTFIAGMHFLQPVLSSPIVLAYTWGMGYWAGVLGFGGLIMFMMFMSNSLFGIKLYFLNR